MFSDPSFRHYIIRTCSLKLHQIVHTPNSSTFFFFTTFFFYKPFMAVTRPFSLKKKLQHKQMNMFIRALHPDSETLFNHHPAGTLSYSAFLLTFFNFSSLVQRNKRKTLKWREVGLYLCPHSGTS